MTNKLEKADIKIFGDVFLHGSRGMYNKSFYLTPQLPQSTDWDYAAQHTQSCQQLLEDAIKAGWVECVDKSYMDDDTTFVFERSINGNKVQVSMRQNLLRYKDCFNSIDVDFYFKYLWKSSGDCLSVEDRRKFFNSLYSCWDSGR